MKQEDRPRGFLNREVMGDLCSNSRVSEPHDGMIGARVYWRKFGRERVYKHPIVLLLTLPSSKMKAGEGTYDRARSTSEA